MAEEIANGTPVEPPRGFHDGKMDEKGRLRIPRIIELYLRSQPEARFFVTTVDKRTARIYPIGMWRDNENFFNTYLDNPGALRRVRFMANRYGADAELDGQARVLFPVDLRRELGLETKDLKLSAFNGFVEVIGPEEFARMESEAMAAPEDSLDILARAGFK